MLLLSIGAYVGTSACRQVVGIEDAEVDPNLSRPSAGGSGSMASLSGDAGAVPTIGGAGEMSQAGAGADGLSPESSGGQAGDAGQVGAGSLAGESAGPSLCDQYCTLVSSSCTGTFAVYTSYATCLSVCAALPQGVPGDRKVNSVQCRLHAAVVARDEVAHYCPIAGPGGNGECGSNCEGLCTLREKICADYLTSDLASCLKTCGMLTDLRTFSTDPNAGLYSGPHVECRLYHVSAAAAADPEQHCLHVDGAAPCR